MGHGKSAEEIAEALISWRAERAGRLAPTETAEDRRVAALEIENKAAVVAAAEAEKAAAEAAAAAEKSCRRGEGGRGCGTG